MTVITTEQLEKDFSSVRALIDCGETLLLTEDGVSLGMFSSIAADVRFKGKRKLGGLEGTMKIPADFDTMMEAEIEEMFYGK